MNGIIEKPESQSVGSEQLRMDAMMALYMPLTNEGLGPGTYRPGG